MQLPSKPPVILAIESSCDDTAAAVLLLDTIVSNVTVRQVAHAKYGGVVPELASRKHQEMITAVVALALDKADISQDDLNAIAVTSGPGLLGSLLVGMSFAKGMALARNLPLITVNHMQAHILAHFIDLPTPTFPFLCLTVSGGHTQIVRVDDHLKMELLGKTLDDAAGEAFDKGGKLLGLPYPAGPEIDRLAKQGVPKYPLPVPSVPALNFSFSGMKTAFRYFLRDAVKSDPAFVSNNLADICASLQQSIIQALVHKLVLASEQTGITEIAIAGGVSANSGLRRAVTELAAIHRWQIYIPKLEYCTDNAAMIAKAAEYKWYAKDFADLDAVPETRLAVETR